MYVITHCVLHTIKRNYIIIDIFTFRERVSTVSQAPMDDFYRGNKNLPVYSRSAVRYDIQEVVTILLDPELSVNKICTRQPTDVAHNTAFVVDVSKLKCFKDLYCDDMGSWHCNGIYKSWIEVDFIGFVTLHGKCKPSMVNDRSYCITKKYFYHKTSKDLKKTVSFLAGKQLSIHSFMLVYSI